MRPITTVMGRMPTFLATETGRVSRFVLTNIAGSDFRAFQNFMFVGTRATFFGTVFSSDRQSGRNLCAAPLREARMELSGQRSNCRRFCAVKTSDFQQIATAFNEKAHNRFNINQLRTVSFNKVQQALESGSGPGALPGAPHGTLLDSTAENLRC